jgi:hypothetical protein
VEGHVQNAVIVLLGTQAGLRQGLRGHFENTFRHLGQPER